MHFCSNCIMPSTRPDLEFDKRGFCDACITAENKAGLGNNPIDWDGRKAEFEKIIENYAGSGQSDYDCLIPVSGGKDSTYQVHTIMHQYGLRPLCLCFEPTLRTELGERNLTSLNRMGVDLIQVRRNPIVYEKLVLEGFRRVGDMEWPNHAGIWSTPYRFAAAFDIPLIIWGEGRMEYAGTQFIDEKHLKELDEDWATDYGCLNGMRPEDLISEELGITERDIQMYRFPSKEKMQRVAGNKGIVGLFLGYYFNWQVRDNVEIIEQYGWERHDGHPDVTYCDFNNLDCLSMNLTDYVKFCKYGYGRATDDACRDRRDNLIDREQAVRLAERYDGIYPKSAMIAFCKHFKMSQQEFDEVCDNFTNPAIFETKGGKFIRDIDNSLVIKSEIVEARRHPNYNQSL